MMRVIFTRLARQELEDAVGYYELEYSGLGRRFKEEVRKAVLRIVAYPEAWSIERGDVRRCLLHKFPYKLMYSGRIIFLLSQWLTNTGNQTTGLVEMKHNKRMQSTPKSGAPDGRGQAQEMEDWLKLVLGVPAFILVTITLAICIYQELVFSNMK